MARRGTGGDSGPAVPPDGSDAAAVETPVDGADQTAPPPAAAALPVAGDVPPALPRACGDVPPAAAAAALPVAGDVPPAAEGWPDIAAAEAPATVASEASDPDHVPEDQVDHA